MFLPEIEQFNITHHDTYMLFNFLFFLFQVTLKGLTVYNVIDDGGSLLLSKVDPQLKQAQAKVTFLLFKDWSNDLCKKWCSLV